MHALGCVIIERKERASTPRKDRGKFGGRERKITSMLRKKEQWPRKERTLAKGEKCAHP
jgi:hypothetical protein